MVDTCFIHIGAPKTGSTTLQHFLCDNRRALAEHNLYYPQTALRGFGHHDIAYLLNGGYQEWATPQEKPLATFSKELRAELSDVGCNIILSSEVFYLYPEPEKLKQFLDDALPRPFDLKIVVYLRRQDDAHESWYNQTIKAQGYTHEPQQCRETFWGLWDYEQNLERWGACFGGDGLIVRSYDAAIAGKDGLVGDFLSALGVLNHKFRFERPEVNASFPRELVIFQKMLNRLPVPTVEKRRYLKDLIALKETLEGTGFFSDRPFFCSEERSRILESYEESNQRVARKYLGSQALFENDNSTEENAPNVETGPGSLELDEEKVAVILGWLLFDSVRAEIEKTGSLDHA